MPLNRSAKTAIATRRRARPTHPRCRGGASSLLRLNQPAAARLPNVLDLSLWLDRAANAVLPVTGPHFEFGA